MAELHVLSLSGGKDSVAMWLWARRTGLDPIPVYVDTGWEWPGHHAYLDQLETLVGPITRVRAESGLVELTRKKRTFPSRVRRWCTEELKIKPFATELARIRAARDCDCVVLVGVRREESVSRAALPEREWADHYDCEVWRPLLDWSLADVVAEHHSAGVPLHPLYRMGAERVGCFPCVGAPKSELALVARVMPERIAQIRSLELEIGATMFTRDRRTEKRRTGTGPSVEPVGIDEVVAWSRTDRGGQQMTLEPAPTGCMRWGICEPRGA